MSGMPATAMMSPGPASLGRHPVERLGHQQLGDLDPLDGAVGPAPGHLLALADARPARTRHSASRPRYGDASRLVTCACSGAPSSYDGRRDRSPGSSGTAARGRRRPAWCRRRAARGRPGRPSRTRRRSGSRSGRSSASRSRNSSYVSSTTSAIRASGRSTLLMTRTTGSRFCSALRSTNRVCGSGPSLASTSSSTPSTISRPRSTSPPKSA